MWRIEWEYIKYNWSSEGDNREWREGNVWNMIPKIISKSLKISIVNSETETNP